MPRLPVTPPRKTSVSFRICDALLIKGREVPHFEANFSFFSRAAVANFMAGGHTPKTTSEINLSLDTVAKDQALVKVTTVEKKAFKAYARTHGKQTLGALFNSSIGHALGVLHF